VDNGWPARGDARDHVDPARFPFPVTLVQNAERSYASGINRGAAVARGEILVACNSDVEWLPRGSVAPLLAAFDADPRLGIAGPRQLFPDGSAQRSYGPVPGLREVLASMLFVEGIGWRLAARRRRGARAVPYVDGAFLATRRTCFAQLGGFDERFGFYAEDIDYCVRAAGAGWRCLHVPDATVMHVRGATSMRRAPLEYLERLADARRRIVARRAGAAAAARYGWWLVLASLERAVLWSVAALVRPAWRERAAHMRDWARAAARTARRPVAGP
jgi:GT2 family glycosyltransferase